MFTPPITYPDFFLRALTPGVEYVELAAGDSCLDLLGAQADYSKPMPCFPPDQHWYVPTYEQVPATTVIHRLVSVATTGMCYRVCDAFSFLCAKRGLTPRPWCTST